MQSGIIAPRALPGMGYAGGRLPQTIRRPPPRARTPEHVAPQPVCRINNQTAPRR